MHLTICLLAHLVCIYFVSCQNTVYKCNKTCDRVTVQQEFEKNTTQSRIEDKNHNSPIFKPSVEMRNVLALTLEKTRCVWKNFWNFSDGLPKISEKGRTFGIRRRLQLFFILPISFKLGVIVTLLMVLTAMSLKGLIIGFLILTLILVNTNAHSKLWGAPKPAGLIDLDNRNLHIHVHASPTDNYYYRPHNIDNINNWHERSLDHNSQSNWHNSLSTSTITFQL